MPRFSIPLGDGGVSNGASDEKERISRRRFVKRTAGLATAALAGGALLHSAFIELTRHVVRIANLPAELDGLKVAFAADIHLGAWFGVDKVRAAVDLLNRLDADLILLGGDYVTESPDYYPSCFAELGRLSAPLGVYAVPGNHDNWGGLDRFLEAAAGTSITPLVNEGVALGGDSPLWVAGLDDVWGGAPDMERATAGRPDGVPVIAVGHNPYTAEEIPADSADLLLCGHTHGWQIYLPCLSRMFIPENLSKYRCGFFDTPAGLMYVTRGVGLSLARFRMFCRPEVTLFRLSADRGRERGAG
jgi:predicted MPP superfamily phosphohydrolase